MATSIYITPADLRLGTDQQFIVEISDDNEDNTPDEGVLQWGVDTANGIVDGYVQIAPGLPATITPILRLLAIKIAIYELASRRRVVEAALKEERDWAILQLEKIRDGDFTTGDGSTTVTSGAINALQQNKTDADKRLTEEYLDVNFPSPGNSDRRLS